MGGNQDIIPDSRAIELLQGIGKQIAVPAQYIFFMARLRARVYNCSSSTLRWASFAQKPLGSSRTEGNGMVRRWASKLRETARVWTAELEEPRVARDAVVDKVRYVSRRSANGSN